jgi:Fe(3+) dicitrate transport protein
MEFGRWTIAPGVRFEDIDQSRVRYETRPDLTADPASRAPDNLRDVRENRTSVWLPGIGVLYRLNDMLTLLGGVHKGFSAPPNAPGVDEEDSLNYELGVRLRSQDWHAEAIAFLTDFKNLLGICTASSGSDCEIGDAFNGDAATIRGLEVRAGFDLAGGNHSFQVPVEISWTWTDSKFDTTIADTEYWGDVSKGDPIPYIPEQQLQTQIGFLLAEFSADLSASYVDSVCTRPACGPFEETDASLTFDLGAAWAFREGFDLFARLENLTNEKDIMGRQPYGARPNKARTAAVGIRLTF